MGIWGEELRIKYLDNDGNSRPIKMWTSVWDNRCGWSHYLYFEEYFVKPLYNMLGHKCDYNLSPKILRFLRPKDMGHEVGIIHNWGDWYMFGDCIVIRVYGFEVAPYFLFKIVPDRVAYLEIIRQLSFSDFMHLKSYGRQTFMSSTLCFGDFTIISYSGYDLVSGKLDYYGLPIGNKREKFDPEHFICDAKNFQKLKGYEHSFLLEDVIKNCEENQKIMRWKFL